MAAALSGAFEPNGRSVHPLQLLALVGGHLPPMEARPQTGSLYTFQKTNRHWPGTPALIIPPFSCLLAGKTRFHSSGSIFMLA
jgi:hypothetical protein